MMNDDIENSFLDSVTVMENQTIKKDYNPYFEGHVCVVPSSMKKKHEIIEGNAFIKFIHKITTVDKGDLRARYLFKSYTALQRETHRQIAHYPLSIHPYSKLRLWLEALTVVILFMLNTFVIIFYCTTDKTLFTGMHLQKLEFVYLVIIIANCFTGYVEEKHSLHVVLELKKILWKYVTTYFIIDVVSITGIFNANQEIRTYRYCCRAILYDSAKILRTPTFYKYTTNLMKVKRVGVRKEMAVHVALLLYLYLQWNIFFQFSTEYYAEGTYFPENPRNCSWMTTAHLWNETITTKFVYSLHRAVAMMRENTGLITTTEDNTGCFEYFFIISWIVAKIMILNGTFNYIIKAFGLESARAKYFMMAKQVQTFMEHRKFPPRLKKKILKFYAIRFQSHFFVESRMIACVSGQLREDILMHSGRQLINDVEFLKTLPRQLHLQIGIKLGIAIFIAGDIIFKINTSGDCMYFIDRGTVAIYSESGKEVCHLRDGDFFGEIALVMKHRFRTASVVAVTNCELFRLERADFESSIACYPTVYEEIKKVATNRYERTMVIDDHYRRENRESTEKKSRDSQFFTT